MRPFSCRSFPRNRSPRVRILSLEAEVDAVGFEADREWNLELHVQNDKGQLVKREQRTLKAASGKPAFTTFVIGGLTRPITQGELRLVSSDPYPVDDIRYFTVAVVPPVSVLVIGERRDETNVVEQALAPSEYAKLGKARYKVTYRPASQMSKVDFKAFDIVCLDNVAAPTATVWSSLGDFVDAGGGLLVIAGNDRVAPESYNSGAAQAFLPGSPDRQCEVARAGQPRLARFQPPDLQEIRACQRRIRRAGDGKGFPSLGRPAGQAARPSSPNTPIRPRPPP